tara:strand:- start:30940 stop:31308 length:369 start_codon:yes stop_codon:yes gene_type:complete
MGNNKKVSMELRADRILQVFRGDREIDPENLAKVQEGFNERGYIKLRSLERILFGSDVDTAEVLTITSCSKIALEKGLVVLAAPSDQLPADNQQVEVIIYNSTPFLNKIEKGEVIAQAKESF